MINYIKDYCTAHENDEQYNEEFLSGDFDYPMSHYAIIAMKEFEVIDNVKILGYEIIDDADEVNMTYHKTNINMKRKDLDEFIAGIKKKKYVCKSFCGEIIFHIELTTNLNKKVIEKRIILPQPDEEGLYMINGKRSKAIAQIVDKNTYSQRGKITLKSRMPIVCYCTKNRQIRTHTGIEYPANIYSFALDVKVRKSNIGKKRTKFINPLMLFSCKLGLTRAIEFFGYQDIVKIVDNVKKEKYFEHFTLNELYIRVPRAALEEEKIRNFVCMLQNLYSLDFPVTKDNMNDRKYWICRLGLLGSIKDKNLDTFEAKGITTIYMVERLMDKMTKEFSLRLPEFYKYNVYYLLRWMVENFEVLKLKSNMNLENKRIRINEAIVQGTLGKKVSSNINKLIEKKSKSRLNDMETLCELFNFNSDIILSGMKCMSDQIKSDEIVNDMNWLMDLAFTFKGYQSMGEASGKRIANKYRDIDISFIGRIDPNSTSNSDPGMSGHFTPYMQLYDRFFFSPEQDPHEGHYEAAKLNFHYGNIIDQETGEVVSEALSPEYGAIFKDFESYMKWAEKNESFIDDLKELPIKIVEKELFSPDGARVTAEEYVMVGKDDKNE